MKYSFDIGDFNSYDSLIKYFRTWNKDDDLYTERHHVLPRCEGVSEEVIDLPVKYHFMAHLLRARESIDPKTKRDNYLSAWMIGHSRGPEKGVDFKSWCESLKDYSILEECSRAMRDHMIAVKQDPKEQMRKIVRLEDSRMFDGVNICARELSISAGNLVSHLKGSRNHVDGQHFRYVEEGTTRKRTRTYKNELEEELTKEKNEKEMKHLLLYRTKFVQIETKSIFVGLKDIERTLGLKSGEAGHVPEVCEGKRKTTLGTHWKYYKENEEI